MKALYTLCLGLLVALPARAADDVTLTFAWPDGATWRVVETWSATATSGPNTTELSGVVRGPWTWASTGKGGTLTAAPSLVRASPRGDAAVLEVSAELEAGFVVSLFATPEVVPPVPQTMEEGATDAMPEDGAPVPEVVAVEPEVVAAEPVEAEVPVMVGAPRLTTVVAGGMDRLLDRVFVDFDGQKLPLGRDMPVNAAVADPRTGEAIQLDLVRRVDAADICPGMGPGPACVTITLIASSPGAGAEGALSPGQRRDVAVWTVEAGTMVPHAATVTTEMVYQTMDAAGVISPVSLKVERVFHFLPVDVPGPLAEG